MRKSAMDVITGRSRGDTMELPAKPDSLTNLEFVRNLTTYVFARRLADGRSVLDVGCGTGHGAWLLSVSGASRTTAVDLDKERVRQVSELCSDFPGFRAQPMDAQRLEFQDGGFQLITCFEVIEHVPRPDMLLDGIRRNLSADGLAVISTPNRLVRLLPFQLPWNREHLREYTLSGFRETLAKRFPAITVFGIHGEPSLEGYYRELWRQRPARAYADSARRLAAAARRAVIGSRSGGRSAPSGGKAPGNSHSQPPEIPIPAPQGESWPFHLSDPDEGCLNFLAVCGFDEAAVRAAADRLRPQSA
jgi:ubiquinone/menaquinone biosynthesis C-methylase UbiE